MKVRNRINRKALLFGNLVSLCVDLVLVTWLPLSLFWLMLIITVVVYLASYNLVEKFLGEK